GVFSLEDEKPLTGSFTLSEPLKTEDDYAEEIADVPLVGSFNLNNTEVEEAPAEQPNNNSVENGFSIDKSAIMNDPKILEIIKSANIPNDEIEKIATSLAESISEKISNYKNADENKELEKV
ncbi:MAG: hypothetical protein U0O22_03805, partial [Acutalibacteraceae bacterium]